MIQQDDFIIYVADDGTAYPATVDEIKECLRVNLTLLSPYVGIFNDVPFSAKPFPETWYKPDRLTYKLVTQPKGTFEMRFDESIDLQKDDPKSNFYQVPQIGKSPAYSLARYWSDLVGTMPIGSQLKAAKKLVDDFGYEKACRITKYYAYKKYTLNWLSKHPEVIAKEFA